MSGAAAACEANYRLAKDVAFRGLTWLLRGAWGCCLRMRTPGGEGGGGAATRRRDHGTVAEVVASVDLTVPTAVGDAAHVHLLTSGSQTKGT